MSLDVLSAAAASPKDRDAGVDGGVLAEGLAVMRGAWPLHKYTPFSLAPIAASKPALLNMRQKRL